MKLFPLTTKSIVWHHFNKKSIIVLDVGCGTANQMYYLRMNGYKGFSVGIDIFIPYITESKKHLVHNEYILCDARYLPFRENSFDTVISFEMIEHLEKSDGINLILTIEKLAKKQVMVSTVTDFQPQDSFDENIFQEHKSAWYPEEFRTRGYHVYGTLGLRTYGNISKICKVISRFIQPFPSLLRFLTQPLVYTKPEISFLMLCVKNKVI